MFLFKKTFCSINETMSHGNLTKGEGLISTVDLLVLTSLGQLLLILKVLFIYKTSYLNEEVNCTKPSPSVRVP
jgi:hypothetical protein